MEATYDSPAHDPVFFFLAHGRHRKRNILFKYARWSETPAKRTVQDPLLFWGYLPKPVMSLGAI